MFSRAAEAFDDRREAGQELARALRHYAGRDDVVVLGLPRGGVPVAAEVARALGAPLDVLLVRKLGVPGQRELAFGAISTGGVRVFVDEIMRAVRITPQDVERVAAQQEKELERQQRAFIGERQPVDVQGRVAIIVDDGLATGATMRAAVHAVQARGAARVVAAVPVGARESCAVLEQEADELVCVRVPPDFRAVGMWYRDFSEVEDEDVRRLIQAFHPESGGAVSRLVRIPLGDVVLEGQLDIPEGARGLVLFAHGSGSSRHSPRNRHVAHELQQGGLGTLLIDLLSAEEESVDQRTRHLRFDIDMLARRVFQASHWLDQDPETRRLDLGLFGASTGAAAALKAAAARPERVKAVVSRGGRPDLAGADLPRVQAPTLLIVGSRDEPVIELNEQAMEQMRCPVQLNRVAGATHLFEEPGTLEQAAALARDWFLRHLGT